jgi:hypothetical protein
MKLDGGFSINEIQTGFDYPSNTTHVLPNIAGS